MKIYNTGGIFFIILLSVFLSFHIVKGDETQEQKVSITDISTYSKIVDDWKTPGRYAPVNLFDGDVSTCFAVETDRKNEITDRISVTVSFDKPVNIDEIKIVNGFAKDQKTFDENTRIKKLNLYIFKPEENENEKESYILETIELKDVKEYQSVKLSREYFTKKIEMGIRSGSGKLSGREPGDYQVFYGGSKYEDICISELEFYYKGKKVNTVNSKTLKADYKRKLHNDLVKAFSDKIYSWGDSDGAPEITTYKDGRIIYGGPMFGPKPTRWKVKNSKLYIKIDKWLHFEYMFYENSIILYNPEYEAGPGRTGQLQYWRYERELKKKKSEP